MKILGIDYGLKKVGLAISEGVISQPLKVIRYKNIDKLYEEIKRIIRSEKIEEVVVGVSEGKMAEESRIFAKKVGAKTFDETLSTHFAKELSKVAKIGRLKRRNMEDAYAACVMLQSYLE